MFDLKILLSSAILASSIMTARGTAQEEDGGGGSPFTAPVTNVYKLLEQPLVRKDLEITEKQEAEIKLAGITLDRSRRDAHAAFRRWKVTATREVQLELARVQGGDEGRVDVPNTPEFKAMVAGTMEEMNRQLRDATEATYAKILTKAQRRRLEQIDLQRLGPKAIFRPDVASKLDITDEQVAQFREIRSGNREANLASMQARREIIATITGLDGEPPTQERIEQYLKMPRYKDAMAAIDKSGAARKAEMVQSIDKVLTKRQKDRFNKMLGKPFKFAKPIEGPEKGTRAKDEDPPSPFK